MEQPTHEELMVISALQSMETLQAAVKASPLAYEDHLSEITDIMYRAAEAKSVVIKAMANDSYREIQSLTTSAKFGIAGW